jgi:hypothetical protein
MRPLFTYMTSSSRLFVPLVFNSCSSVMNINGRVQAGYGLPRLGLGRVRQVVVGSGTGALPLSATAVRASALLPGPRPSRWSTARAQADPIVNYRYAVVTNWLTGMTLAQEPPSSVVTWSDAQMAKIKGWHLTSSPA